MSPAGQAACIHLADCELDTVSAGWLSISVAPSVSLAPTVTVQTNVANQVANAVLSSSYIVQVIGQSNQSG